MPDRKLKADSDTVDYILNMYSTYIDNLQITKLKELLSKDTHDYDEDTIKNVINSIMQLIVDECGSDIVNDLSLPRQGDWGYYRGVIFNQHVNVRKDNIRPYEFSYAEFADGITIRSKKLPKGALMGARMYGTIDLTSVEVLESSNLNYMFVENCTVKLSKSLKEINAGSFLIDVANKPMIEYDGTVEEFNELIENNISRLAKRSDKSIFIITVKALSIKCNDGTWTYELLSSDK